MILFLGQVGQQVEMRGSDKKWKVWEKRKGRAHCGIAAMSATATTHTMVTKPIDLINHLRHSQRELNRNTLVGINCLGVASSQTIRPCLLDV